MMNEFQNISAIKFAQNKYLPFVFQSDDLKFGVD